MVSTYSPNIQLEEPARGDQVSTWDTPVNSNMTLIDKAVGGSVTIPLAGSAVVLSAAQFQCRQITFNSTLTANVLITFPTSFTKDYQIQNLCTGSSAFNISLISNGLQIGAPPGQIVDVVNDGTNMKYKNLPPIGTYLDYAGTSIPAWIANCGVAPYLNCDGSTFSAATFPVLANILGGTTLPDARGRFRATLNQATGRLVVGVDGNTRGAAGGDQYIQQHQHTGTTGVDSPDHVHSITAAPSQLVNVVQGSATTWTQIWQGTVATQSGGANVRHSHTFTSDLSGSGQSQNVPPVYMGGLTLIRAG